MRIVGLIGRNGAGKTTALKALLGLTPFDGVLTVLGRDPMQERLALTREISFIPDVGILPKWLRVRTRSTTSRRCTRPSIARAPKAFLRTTDIRPGSRVRELSKGMVTQLQLALVLAIRARLLVLDEPTVGLDLLYRRRFYDTLVNDYMDEERTILVTSHQVEEVENLLTDVMFIERGRIVLDTPVDDIAARYVQLVVGPAQVRGGARAGAFLRARSVRSQRHVLRRPPRPRRLPSSERSSAPRWPTSSLRDARRSTMNEIKMLVRRELWEHRSLYRAPAVIAGLLVLGHAVRRAALWRPRGRRASAARPRSPSRPASTSALGGVLPRCAVLVGAIVSFTYLLDCLYAERKDPHDPLLEVDARVRHPPPCW